MVYSFRSIQNKIIFWALLPCFLVIGAFTLVALLTIKNTALNVVTQRDVVLAEFAGKRLSENIRPYPLFLQKLAAQQAAQKRDYRQLEALFESSNNWLHLFDEGLALYDEQGVLLWTSGKDIPLSAAQYPVQADFKRIKTTLRPLFSNILFQNSWDNGVVLVTVPIMGKEGTFDGALTGICSVKYSTIGATYTRVLEYEAGKSSYAYLVDGEGTVLYHRHSSLIGSKIDEREIVRTVIQGNSGAMMTNNRAGERVISGYAPVPGTNWGVVTQGDWSSIKDLIELYNRFFQLVLWGGCLMIVLFVFFFIQKLLRPIQHLTRGAAQVSRGNLVEIPVDKTSDELEMLSKQFNSMIRAMKSAFAANAERIEELDKARLELSRSEEKIRSIINSVTDIMFLVERSGLIVWVNERGKQIFGAKAEGSKYTHVFYQQDEAPEDCFIQEFFSGSLDTDIELKIWSEEKYSDYWCSANAVQSAPDGKVLKIVVVFRNITEKKRLQAEIQKNAQLAALGELAAGVAHEINNPITGIINYAQIIDDCWDQKDTKHGQLPEWIIQEGERIAGIVSKLLSFARSDIEKKQPVSLDELLSLVLALIGTMLKKDAIQVDLRLADDLPPVWAVQHQIHQVFLNLLSNARYALNAKFSDRNPQKRITITAKEYKAAAGPMVRIIFKDYGTGIASHDLEKVCNPFFSTKPPGDGTGLGLSISYGIIEEHGGELTIESVVGEWTRVIIDLPSYQ